MSEESTVVQDVVIPTAMVVAQPTDPVSLAELADLGIITPLATPTRLRALFAEKQRLYAAILDESDYLYAVSFMEQGKMRQNMYSRRADAEKCANNYQVEIRATPKKSGIVKLASALGITARRTTVKGLPDDPAAAYSYVVYVASHERSGKSEEGIGWCDKSERGGRISTHDVIATADTRAYNRAVLRLSGFGDVSADEIVSGGAQDDAGITSPEISAALKKPLALQAPASDDILIAQRCWAEESAKRTAGFVAEAQQSSKAAREMRAKARRGNDTAARQMGSLGYTWQGPAQDSPAYEPFDVEEPTVKVSDFERLKNAAGPGWDLSGTGSVREENRKPDELKPVSREQAAAGVPAPGIPGAGSSTTPVRDGNAETITSIQAKRLSEKLLAKFGTADKAREFLRKHADVERSALVRQNQLAKLEELLTKED
jgi:hypothetical protein